MTYPAADTDAACARAAFRWLGGAVRLVEPYDYSDPRVRRADWGHMEKDPHCMPFYPDVEDGHPSKQPWVWRYGTASAGTGSAYGVVATRLHLDVASKLGGPILVTVTSPWQDAHALATDGWLDESYVAEHLTGGRAFRGQLHAGDLTALTLLTRKLLGRDHDTVSST